jgi:hypothetical protein
MNGFDVFTSMAKIMATETGNKHVIVTKLEEVENAVVPNNKKVGYQREGKFLKQPTVGEAFYIGDGFRSFRTSTVTEILSENIFRTLNSVYKWQLIEPLKNDK